MEKKISDTGKKFLTVVDFLKTDCNAKITEIEIKIPSISGLATNFALTAVENKIPDISSLVKKTDYETKISDIEKKITDHDHDKYITTSEFNNLTAESSKKIDFNRHTSAWKSKGLSDESIKTLSAPNNILNTLLANVGAKTMLNLNGSCLKQDKVTFIHGKTLNIYMFVK